MLIIPSTLDHSDKLLPKAFEPIRQLRAAFALVCELADEQGERLGVSSDLQGASVYCIESCVMDELGSDIFGSSVVATIHQASAEFLCF
jgi:hypothetical protein